MLVQICKNKGMPVMGKIYARNYKGKDGTLQDDGIARKVIILI